MNALGFTALLSTSLLLMSAQCGKEERLIPDPENPTTSEKEYTPVGSELKQVRFTGVTLTPYVVQSESQTPEKTLDGVVDAGSHLWNSGWSGIDPSILPLVLEYTVEETTASLDYITIYPKPEGGNGVPEIIDVYAAGRDNGEYEKYGTIDNSSSNGSGAPVSFFFPKTIDKPSKVKLEIQSAYHPKESDPYVVTFAELEGWSYGSDYKNDMALFTDASCSQLASGVTQAQIGAMHDKCLKNVAEYLLKGKYDPSRTREYEAYLNVRTLAKQLKTSNYSQFENPTGITFSQGDTVVVFVENPSKQALSLRVTNFGNEGSQYSYPQSDNSYVLHHGYNVLIMKGKGNGYISYFTTSDPESLPKVKINISSGKVCGYFDLSKDDNDTWKKLLENDAEILDIVGERIMISFPRTLLKKHSPDNGVELIQSYDGIVKMEQELMGLDKYGRVPKNHMFGRMKFDNGSPWADSYGMAYPDKAAATTASVSGLASNGWGPYHELGHVNQVRPGFRWKGTTEITNNLFSLWCQYNINPTAGRLDYTKADAGDGLGKVCGGLYNDFIRNICNTEENVESESESLGNIGNGNWLRYRMGTSDTKRHFSKLVPLWQLHLYYHVANGMTAYPDFFETIRTTEDCDNGQSQINYFKYFCDAVKEDLTEFFVTSKIVMPFSADIKDYGTAKVTITEDMVKKAKEEVARKGYAKPASSVIHYCTSRTVGIFKDRSPLSDAEIGSGISLESGIATIQSAVWKNAVAFEAYDGDELKSVSVAYTGDDTGTKTLLACPDGTDTIKAVQWDGTRKTVYTER